MGHHISVVVRMLGRLDMAKEMATQLREMLSESIDMERAMWQHTGVEVDEERKALMEEALQRLYHAETTLTDAFNAVQELYPIGPSD
jgi:ATP-dependent protease HslVU (ClpYQ) ATPase subunit